jgi:hypothetical protein
VHIFPRGSSGSCATKHFCLCAILSGNIVPPSSRLEWRNCVRILHSAATQITISNRIALEISNPVPFRSFHIKNETSFAMGWDHVSVQMGRNVPVVHSSHDTSVNMKEQRNDIDRKKSFLVSLCLPKLPPVSFGREPEHPPLTAWAMARPQMELSLGMDVV